MQSIAILLCSQLIDGDWIVRDLIVIFFGSKNLDILFVKRSEKKAAICLVRFLFLNQVVINSSRACLWVSVIY